MARAIERVPPAEKGTRDTKPNSRSQVWKRRERELCRALSKADGVNELFTRMKLTTSTGRIGHIVSLQADGVSKHYVLECKARSTGLSSLYGWWSQLCQVGRTYNLAPCIGIYPENATYTFEGKEYKLPPMHAITESRHLHLLACEKRCEELDNGPSTPPAAVTDLTK